MPPHDLASLKVRELLMLEVAIVEELRRRGLVRTNNKPLGDIGEQIVLHARGGVLEPNSTKSHDITTRDAQRIQVKAMGVRAATGGSAKFSPFRSAAYDTAIFLVFESAQFGIAEAYEVPSGLIAEHIRYVTHVNGRQPTLREVRQLGTDVSAEMRAAYASIDSGIV